VRLSPALRAIEAVISIGAEEDPTGDVMEMLMGSTVMVSAVDGEPLSVNVMAATVRTVRSDITRSPWGSH
jgi:hypothetical protein